MAAKLTITTTFAWTDGKDSLSAKGSQTYVPASQIASESIQTIPTSTWTSVNLAGVTPAYTNFENKDTANTVTVASDNAGAHVVAVLKAGESCIVQGVTAFWAQATIASVNLLVTAVPA